MAIDAQVHVFPRIPYIGNIDREYTPELLVALMDDVGRATLRTRRTYSRISKPLRIS